MGNTANDVKVFDDCRTMTSSRTDCTCSQLAGLDDARVCHECGHSELTSVPFNVSGETLVKCPLHGTLFPLRTKLLADHATDSSGYTYCGKCGLVFDVEPKRVSPWVQPGYAYEPDHYGRLLREKVGFVPRGRRAARRALAPGDNMRIKRQAMRLRDTETILSFLGASVQRDLVLHAVNDFFSTPRQHGTLQTEAFLCAIVRNVLQEVGNTDTDKMWNAFGVDSNQQSRAQLLVDDWWHSYWK